jgi:hypothetical protein
VRHENHEFRREEARKDEAISDLFFLTYEPYPVVIRDD